MNRRDLFKMCLQNLSRHRGRTMLTVLGVVVGCCAVIIMMSIGIGMKQAQEKMLAELGDLTVITVTPAGKAKLTSQAVRDIQKLPQVEVASPKLVANNVSLKIYAGTNRRYISDSPTIVGLNPEAIEKLGYRLVEGETLSKKPLSVLIGQDFSYSFLDSKRPEGRNMVYSWPDETGKVPDPYLDAMTAALELELSSGVDDEKKLVKKLTVSGRLKEDYGKGWETSSGIIMSIDDLNKLLDGQRRAAGKAAVKKQNYDTVLVKVRGIRDVEPVEKEIKEMGFRTSSMESIRKPMEKEARQKQMMFGGLGAISLLVAALGIANTMMMSITERTREIGIMKSLGCYVRDIRRVFLLEAGCIGLLGGMIGSIMSGVISLMMNLLSNQEESGTGRMVMSMSEAGGGSPTSVIPLWLILFALAFSVLIGVVSGYYPTNKAVQIPALEAIKHD